MSELATGAIGVEATAEIEGQHHLQLDLLRGLRRVIESGSSTERIVEIADTLIAFTKMHFASEELMMRLSAYDGYEAHCEAHAHAIERIDDLCETVRDREAVWNRHDLIAIEQWITLHIETSDHAFALYLAGRDAET